MQDPAVLKILTNEPATELVRNTERTVMPIGFPLQGNIGLRSSHHAAPLWLQAKFAELSVYSSRFPVPGFLRSAKRQ